MNETNAHCSICGKGYHVCQSCDDMITFKPWRTVVDSIEHYKIYLTISEYANKVITKEEASEQLKKCQIENYKFFLPHIVKVMDEILKEDVQPAKKSTTKKVRTSTSNRNRNSDKE